MHDNYQVVSSYLNHINLMKQQFKKYIIEEGVYEKADYKFKQLAFLIPFADQSLTTVGKTMNI